MENQGLRTLQKKRTSNFREDETKLLIQLWGSPQVQNKLYLTHRKAPVMRLLAANMQQRGFYRTPDEIKTRIRNLKCLYHRIKRSMQTGVGIGTVDPDWPHFKSMDEILSKRNQNRPQNLYKDGVFEGPRCEDIKQEIIDDIDINDDMESFTTNSLNGSDAEFEDEAHHMPPLTPKPLEAVQLMQKHKEDSEPVKIAPKPAPPPPKVISNTVQNVQIPIQAGIRTTNGTTPGLPFPLLILNGLPTATATTQNHLQAGNTKTEVKNATNNESKSSSDTSTLLANLLQIQTEQLHVEKQRLKLEKQKFKLHQLVGTQILILLPTLRTLFQKLESNIDDANSKNGDSKRSQPDDGFDDLSDSKILKSVLEEGIKKYMMESMNDSDDEDSGIVNDDDNNVGRVKK